MTKIIICRGLPGSGKTTWAKNYIKQNVFSNIIRVNRDDIRKMFGISYNEFAERFVKEIEKDVITKALNAGYDVIVDDTNIYPSGAELIKKAIEESVFETVPIQFQNFFDTPIETCLERQESRNEDERVPEQRLRQFYDYYEKFGKKFERYLEIK